MHKGTGNNIGEQMELATERLIIRPWKELDAESLFGYARDPEVEPKAGWPVHTSVDSATSIQRRIKLVF